MRILADTNVLLRLVQVGHEHHVSAKRAVRARRAVGDQVCIVPQVLYEYWVVATRERSQNGLGFTPERAANDLAELRRGFQLLRDERAVYTEWEPLVRVHSVCGKQAHDARLVAAMLRHGLTHLLTFNSTDFSRYPGITVVDPARLG